uniref:Uncharacterized protein n=1 Tax=uncultured bacterium A1Q1_fos_600 TaxID=1256587 RepID=L7VV34_9BACT|nr:hypothetical protein [uncultured bacterium A1Q1_fos_600]
MRPSPWRGPVVTGEFDDERRACVRMMVGGGVLELYFRDRYISNI